MTQANPAPAKSLQSRNWVFTLNNPADQDDPREVLKEAKFLVFQHEVGKEGTKHIQGYVQFHSMYRFQRLKTLMPRGHWEPRRGSHAQAYEYCTKEDTRVPGTSPTVVGVAPQQGKRTDLDAVKETIDSGSTMLDIADNHFTQFVKYEKGIRSYISLKSKPRDFKSTVKVLYGPTGTGKTMYCSKVAPDAFWYAPQSEGKWWCGYDGTSDVVIDEFYGQIRWSTLLRLLDRTPCTVEIKGGTVNFAPRNIYITSNKHPIEWYVKHEWATLNRRIDFIYRVPTLGTYIAEKLPDPPILPVPDEECLPNCPEEEETITDPHYCGPNARDTIMQWDELPRPVEIDNLSPRKGYLMSTEPYPFCDTDSEDEDNLPEFFKVPDSTPSRFCVKRPPLRRSDAFIQSPPRKH